MKYLRGLKITLKGHILIRYSQMKQGDEAKTTYERTLAEFPGSEMAIAALNMINAVSNNTEQGA